MTHKKEPGLVDAYGRPWRSEPAAEPVTVDPVAAMTAVFDATLRPPKDPGTASYADEEDPSAGVVIRNADGSFAAWMPTDVFEHFRKPKTDKPT